MKLTLLQNIKFNYSSLIFFFTTPIIFIGAFLGEFLLNNTYSINQFYITISLLFLPLAIIISIVAFLLIKQDNFNLIVLILILLLIFNFSILYRYSISDISYSYSTLSMLIAKYPYFYVKTTDFYQDFEKYSRVKAYIIGFTDFNKIEKTKIAIYFYSDSMLNLASGDIYLFKSDILKKYSTLNFLENKKPISLSKIDSIKKIKEGNFINSLRMKIRIILFEKLNLYYDRWNAANIYAILTGSKQFIYQPLIEAFNDTGTSHLFALSGQHLSILLLIVGIFSTNSIILIIFSLIYLAFAGWQVSFLRAFYSLVIALIIKRYKIKICFENIIAILTLLVFITEPQSIISVSFFLSLTAIVALTAVFYLVPKIKGVLAKILFIPLISSLDIFIFQFPLISAYFGKINLLSPFINLIAIPLFSFAIYFTIFSLIFNPFSISSNISSGLFNLLSIFLLLCKRLKIFIIYINLSKNLGFIMLLLIYLAHYVMINFIFNKNKASLNR